MSASTTLEVNCKNNNNNSNINNNNSFRYANMHKYKKPIMDDSLVHVGSVSVSVASSCNSPQLVKSNSYNGTSTRFPLEANANANCDLGIPITAVDGNSCVENAIEESSECDTFLIVNPGAGSSANNRRNHIRSSSSSSCASYLRRNSCWLRTHSFIMRNWYLSYLVPIALLGIILVVGYLSRNYAKALLFWIETQNRWTIFIIFMALFTLVSFPIVVGYLVLLITAGYLFGWWRGWLTVLLGANVGIAIAHLTIRSCRHRIAVHKMIKNETGRAILRVISGPKAFRVVLFTRLTPIPFGLQNVIFGISSIQARDYHLATFLGLLPAQTINVYLGSTLRSMHEVLNDHSSKVTGYISFVIEVICGVALMFWVVQKARKELSETLLNSDYENDGKPIDIQV
ncbi:transmembrane protein 64 isoform X1 [Drosophila hydei]|uniref:Transmembrane protein 64 isoform X1 n=2 Tax=Drosophila hydei TaxID=7224 RepID=A0A6J1LCZ2_DROHY|nr:transmembrane protein 64 isoform X1 [Drosophila hydei]